MGAQNMQGSCREVGAIRAYACCLEREIELRVALRQCCFGPFAIELHAHYSYTVSCLHAIRRTPSSNAKNLLPITQPRDCLSVAIPGPRNVWPDCPEIEKENPRTRPTGLRHIKRRCGYVSPEPN